MTIEEAIKKAIEGGWKYQGNPKTDEAPRGRDVKVYLNDENDAKIYVTLNELVLDPAFWQSLGKAMGWVEICSNPDHGFISGVGMEIGRLGCPVCGHDEEHRVPSTRDNWKKEWHRFIDHLAAGKTAEEYFTDLT